MKKNEFEKIVKEVIAEKKYSPAIFTDDAISKIADAASNLGADEATATSVILDLVDVKLAMSINSGLDHRLLPIGGDEEKIKDSLDENESLQSTPCLSDDGVKRLLYELGLSYDPGEKVFYDTAPYADKAMIIGKIAHGAYGTLSAVTQEDVVSPIMFAIYKKK